MKNMRTLTLMCATVLFAFALPYLSSCGKDDGGGGEKPTEDRISTTLEGEMTLSLAGEGEVTVNWGDGKKDKVELSALPEGGKPGANHRITHTYEKEGRKEISFKGGEITAIATGQSGKISIFRVGGLKNLEYIDCSGEELSSLNIRDFSALRYLDCSGSGLTALTVRDCNELAELDCGSNALEAQVLRTVIAALPDRTGQTEGKLRIAEPPVSLVQSDGRVAEDKNWNVSPSLPLVYVPPGGDPTAKVVAVGTQTGQLSAGVAGTVTFAVGTVNIPASAYDVEVNGLPAGVTVGGGGKVTIGADGTGTLTLAGSASTTAGKSPALTLTLDGTTSASFSLTIAPGPTVSVGAQNKTMGAGISTTFPVTTTNVQAGNYTPTVNGLPTGVVRSGSVTIGTDGTGTLTLEAGSSAAAGVSANVTLTIAGVTSAPFTLTVSSVAIGYGDGRPMQGRAGTTTFDVTAQNIPAGAACSVSRDWYKVMNYYKSSQSITIPTGVSASITNVSSNRWRVTINTTSAAMGVYYFNVSIDGLAAKEPGVLIIQSTAPTNYTGTWHTERWDTTNPHFPPLLVHKGDVTISQTQISGVWGESGEDRYTMNNLIWAWHNEPAPSDRYGYSGGYYIIGALQSVSGSDYSFAKPHQLYGTRGLVYKMFAENSDVTRIIDRESTTYNFHKP